MSDVEVTENIEVVEDGGDNTNDNTRDNEPVRGANRDQDRDPARSPNREDGTRKRTHSDDRDHDDGSLTKRVKPDDAFVVKQLIREEDEGKWALPESLAAHFVTYTKTHINDQDMKKNMKLYALPTNIDCVPTMDNTFKGLLRKEKAASAIDVDGDWEVVQKKVQDVMGPLGMIWEDCKRYEREETEELDMTGLYDRLDMAVLSLGHAMQKISWFRRVHSLSALGALKSVKDTLKEEKVKKIFEEDTSNNLIPKEFDELLKADKGSRTNLLTHFKPPAEKKKAGSSSASSSKTTGEGKERRFLKRTPFPARPSSSGGGGFDDRRNYNNDRYNKGYYNKNQSGKGFQGKHAGKQNFSQHAFVSRLVAQPKTCSSSSNQSIPIKGGDSSAGRKNCKVLGQLEAHNKRPSNIEHSERVGDTITTNTKPIKDSSLYKDEQGGGTGNGSGHRKYAGQGSHQGGDTQGDSVLEQCICHPQRGVPISPNHKLESAKQLCPIPSLQNGGAEGRKIPSEKGRLDVQNRPEGCLLLSSSEHTIPKVGPFQLERETVRVSLPSLRLRSSPKDFYKVNESPCGTLKKTGDSPSYLSRRHVDHGLIPRGGDEGKGHHYVPLLSPRTDNQHQKISSHALPTTGVPGSDCRQPDHVFLSVGDKGPKIDFKVSRGVRQPSDDTKKSLLIDREAVVNRCSSHSSSAPIKISSTNVHLSSGSKNALRGNGVSILRRDTGTKMVDREPGSPKRTTNASSTTRDDHLLRCSQDRGLGSGVSPWINGGSVVRIGEGTKHKHARVVSSRAGYQNLHQRPQTSLHPYEDRQHLSPFIHCQNGRNSESEHVDSGQKNLAISLGARDHDYCRVDPISFEHNSRLGVQERLRFSRVETVSSGVPINLSSDGISRHRPLCIKNIPSDPKILQLESRPRLLSSGCLPSTMGEGAAICLPSILPDYQGSKTNGGPTGGTDDLDHSTLANPTMVSPTHEYGHSGTSVTSSISRSSVKPFGFGTPTTSRLLSKAGGLASLRDRLLGAGISEESSSLIIHSRREGTSQTYESAWKRWSLWCGGRGLDPFTCPINFILDYLAHLFHQGTPSRTIGGHRSAISAYHHPIVVDSALVATGRHPLVSAVMSGINHLRPPQPKYSFTWDVEFVLRLFRSWPLDLTPKQLTIKVTTLLALIGIPRGAELKLFDLRYLADHGQRYVFQLAGTVKNVEASKKPKPIEFHRHTEDKKLCPIECIDQYIALTESWRVNGQPSAFFLCHKKPHKPASKSTLARWIKDGLLLADVDTKVFKAHSLRGASSSKALLKGLTVKEVVDHGRWSLESTWQRYYHKNVDSASKRHQDSILKL